MLNGRLAHLPSVGQSRSLEGERTLPPPSPSSAMSLRSAIPWRVALQQSSPPLHRLRPSSIQPNSETINLQPTASVQTRSCLTHGDHLNWCSHECEHGMSACATTSSHQSGDGLRYGPVTIVEHESRADPALL